MPGNSSTPLSPGSGGDSIYDEDIGGGIKMPSSKIHTGALGVDGGPVMVGNPFAVSVGDDQGNAVDIDPDGALRVEEPIRIVGSSFGSATNGIDTNFWTPTNSGTGSSSSIVSSGFVTLVSGTSNPGFGQITTITVARFIFHFPMFNRWPVRIPTVVVAGSTRTWGMYTISVSSPVNGYYWSLSAAGVLSVNALNSNSGTPTTVSSGSFNGSVSSYVVDTNMHTYEILALTQSAQFFIDGVLVHTMPATTAQLSSTLALPASATSNGTGTSATMELWGGSVLRLGRSFSNPIWKNIHGANAGIQLKTGPGTLRSAIVNAAVNGTTVTLYDATSATNPIMQYSGATTALGTFAYNLSFYTGLFAVTVNAATDVTVVYE